MNDYKNKLVKKIDHAPKTLNVSFLYKTYRHTTLNKYDPAKFDDD